MPVKTVQIYSVNKVVSGLEQADSKRYLLSMKIKHENYRKPFLSIGGVASLMNSNITVWVLLSLILLFLFIIRKSIYGSERHFAQGRMLIKLIGFSIWLQRSGESIGAQVG